MNIITFPDSPYRLHQPFEPAGDQPTAIAQLVEGLNDGLAFQTLLGVTGSGKTFTMANVIAPNKTLAAIETNRLKLAERIEFCRGTLLCPRGLRTHEFGFTKSIENYPAINITQGVIH